MSDIGRPHFAVAKRISLDALTFIAFSCRLIFDKDQHPVMQQVDYNQLWFVDDNRDHCEMISVLLSDDNLEVRTAKDAAQARNLIEEEHFDLYILEAYLLDESGFDLCLYLRAIGVGTPIVFYSAAGTKANMERGLAAGVQRYLFKPDNMGI